MATMVSGTATLEVWWNRDENTSPVWGQLNKVVAGGVDALAGGEKRARRVRARVLLVLIGRKLRRWPRATREFLSYVGSAGAARQTT